MDAAMKAEDLSVAATKVAALRATGDLKATDSAVANLTAEVGSTVVVVEVGSTVAVADSMVEAADSTVVDRTVEDDAN